MALLINNDQVGRVLEVPDAVDVVEDAFTQLGEGDATFQRRTDVWSPTAATGNCFRWAAQFGAIRDPPRLALRMKSDVIVFEEEDGNVTEEWHNVEPGKFMGYILLFDTTSGEIIGLLNDGIIQHVRTGALAGVACKHLARDDASTVGMLGSGGMAETYIEAFAAVQDISKMKVYSPTQSNREEYADEMGKRLDIKTEAVDSSREAVRDVDIVAMCTDARQPIYSRDWIEPGQFIVNTSHAEVGDGLFEDADKVFTGTNRAVYDRRVGSEEEWKSILSDVFDAQSRLYTETDYPLLSEILTEDVVGRENEDEAIFYLNRSAAGIPFSAISNLVYENVKEQEIGVPLPLEWFQQDIRN